MKRIAASLIIMTALATGGYAYAQTADQSGPSQATADTLQGAKPAKPGPIDIEQFSKMDDLKGADTNGDGTLSQDEIQMLVLKRMAEREARRMERRLDMNGDGKVTLDEIQQQRAKEFAALDRTMTASSTARSYARLTVARIMGMARIIGTVCIKDTPCTASIISMAGNMAGMAMVGTIITGSRCTITSKIVG